jgi:hypothetical protein
MGLSEVLHPAAMGREDHEREQDRGAQVRRQPTRLLRPARPSNAPTAARYEAAVGRQAPRLGPFRYHRPGSPRLRPGPATKHRGARHC